MRVRVLTLVIAISSLVISSCTGDESAVRMPVTTDSELALQSYETGLVAFDQLKWDMAWHYFEYAIREDSDFFMAHFWMYFLTSKTSKKVAEEAFQGSAQGIHRRALFDTAIRPCARLFRRKEQGYILMRYLHYIATQANVARPKAEQANVSPVLGNGVAGSTVRLELDQVLFKRLFDFHPMLLDFDRQNYQVLLSSQEHEASGVLS